MPNSKSNAFPSFASANKALIPVILEEGFTTSHTAPECDIRFHKLHISKLNSNQGKANASDNINVQSNQTVIPQPKRIVYVNAIFELQDGSKLPNTKLELVKFLKTKKAIPFHKWVCPACHTIPKYEMSL